MSENKFEVISYEDEVSFTFTLEDGTQESIESEMTFIWEDTLDKFIEKFGADKEYNLRTFSMEKQYRFYVDQLESRIEDELEEIEQSIANKSKFGFEFTGQLHNDD